MNGVAAAANAVSPIGDSSRLHRFVKVVAWVAAAAVVLALLELAGVDVSGWIADLWDTLGTVSPKYVVAAVALQTAVTSLNAVGWLFILRAAYPRAHIPYAPVLATYAVGSALNPILPGNVGSIVVLFMFVAVIPGATFAGVFAGYLVQRIFFSVVGALVYVYLFLSVPGSFSVELGGLRAHPLATALIAVGGAVLIVLVGRIFLARFRKLWEQAKEGGAILSSARAYLLGVVLPSLGGYLGRLAFIAVFLAAFSIPVTLNSVLHVVAGNSVANSTAVTPAGAGVNEAISVVALADYTDPPTAAAFAVAQQLVGTAWNVVFALILVLTVFGWTNGKALVKTSYAEAKQRTAARRSTR